MNLSREKRPGILIVDERKKRPSAAQAVYFWFCGGGWGRVVVWLLQQAVPAESGEAPLPRSD